MSESNGASAVQFTPELFETVPNRNGVVVLVILRVDARADNMVAQLAHDSKDRAIDSEIRRSHICRDAAYDLEEGRLELGHLLDHDILIQAAD